MGLDLLWEITLGSWVTAALILLARLLFGRWLTARGKYLLWLPLLLRLILPFMPPSPTSVLNVLPESVSGEAYLTEITRSDPAEEAGEPGQAPVIVESVRGEELRLWLLRIWLTGAAAVLLFQFLLYRIGAKAMDRLPLCTDPETRSELLRLRQLTGIDGSLRMAWGSAGMLGGLLRPTMVLPVERRKEAAAPIMLHELMHQKSRHLWLGLLLRLLSAAYWFNPIVWLCIPLVRQDCEELCDQMVLDTGLIEAREYSSILYSEGLMNGILSPLPRTNFGGRRGSLRRRIGRIVRSREGRGGRFLPVLLVLCILLFGATSPLSAAAEEDRSPILPGYESMDSYLEALQPELGRFGATFRELTAEGYLKEEEGEWISRTESRSAFTLRRELYGAERELTYYFVLSPFAGEGDEQALCDIAIHITEEEKQQEWDLTYSDLCGRILEDWDALAAAYVGGFRIASPVDVETVLGTDLCRRAAAEAERRGWTETQEEYLQRLCQEPATALGYNGSYQVWVLNGTGLFLYATRPTE